MRKLVSIFVIMSLVITAFGSSFATNAASGVKYTEYAEKLKEVGVFQGSDKGFELEKEPTRLEGAVMFVRLLGGEEEALASNYAHPFTDVPGWGNPYVGYLYHYGLTKGISDTNFGSNDSIIARSYLTFVLRALGYSDATGDFSWAEAVSFAYKNGVIDSSMNGELANSDFLRDHVAKISYNALKCQMKNGEQTLARSLVNRGLLSEKTALEIDVISLFDDSDELVIDNPVDEQLDDSGIEGVDMSDDLSEVYDTL